MAKDGPFIIDLSRGLYRRLNACVRDDRRFSSCSLAAVTWYQFITLAADDFGNMPGDADWFYSETVGRRAGTITREAAEAMLDELIRVRLVLRYESDGDKWLHVDNWEELQPAPRNGRRVRKYPASPFDLGDVNLGKVRGVRGNAGESGGYNDNDNDNDNDKGERASVRPSGNVLLIFPCKPARGKTATTWELRESVYKVWRDAYKGIDVLAILAKARTWCEANPDKQPTADRMRKWLDEVWLRREKDKESEKGKTGGGRSESGASEAELLAALEAERGKPNAR